MTQFSPFSYFHIVVQISIIEKNEILKIAQKKDLNPKKLIEKLATNNRIFGKLHSYTATQISFKISQDLKTKLESAAQKKNMKINEYLKIQLIQKIEKCKI